MCDNPGDEKRGDISPLTETNGKHVNESLPGNPKFTFRPALSEEAGLFYALTKERDMELGTIGHVRIDFGSGGKEFWHTWWPRGKEDLNSPLFREELEELVKELRENGPLKDLNAMYNYCANHNGAIPGGWRQNYGFVMETKNYRYYLRCSPGRGDYHAYLTAFDLRVQKMNMKQSNPEQEFGLTETGKQMLQNAADHTRSHNYSWFVFQDYNTPGEKVDRGLTLPEAIRIYNDINSNNKRLGVMKDEVAAVDLIITLDGKQHFLKDYVFLASFSSDPVIAQAVETLKNEIVEQVPDESMGLGEQML
ncbi:hypothetical protein [Lacrimispora sp.]|uniref:hypothetical protein n=1 Tax=Lacrimispora sp. TaxID=2719234 RepID=UPI0028A6D882|nr:hypothetical protein [Lacrimispora sp.]